MGGRPFILLKAGSRGLESAKLAEIRVANLPKILTIGRHRLRKFLASGAGYILWLWWPEFPRDMANPRGIMGFVIRFTILAKKPAQYPVVRRRHKIILVLSSDL